MATGCQVIPMSALLMTRTTIGQGSTVAKASSTRRGMPISRAELVKLEATRHEFMRVRAYRCCVCGCQCVGGPQFFDKHVALGLCAGNALEGMFRAFDLSGWSASWMCFVPFDGSFLLALCGRVSSVASRRDDRDPSCQKNRLVRSDLAGAMRPLACDLNGFGDA